MYIIFHNFSYHAVKPHSKHRLSQAERNQIFFSLMNVTNVICFKVVLTEKMTLNLTWSFVLVTRIQMFVPKQNLNFKGTVQHFRKYCSGESDERVISF